MRHQHWKTALLFLLVVLQCANWTPLVEANSSPTQADADQGLNLAVSIQGQVSVKRKSWTSYEPVVFGTDLQLGDLLRIDRSSSAKVVCSDLTLREIRVGMSGVPCLRSRPVLWRSGGSMINTTRSWSNDGSYPVVVSPRKTKLLSSCPVLRWTPIKGATSYRITVRGVNLYWIVEVSTNEIIYPDKAPRLEAGTDYKLIVEANGHSSSVEPGLGLGFSLLGSEESKVVRNQQKVIEELHLPEGPTQFLIAHLYAAHGLRAEAIQRLESVSQTFKEASVMRLLGQLYLAVGLTRQAEARYLSSLDVSKSEKDEEGQMVAQEVLADIYQELGNVQLEGQYLEAALALANKIGDDSTASRAEKKLAELKRAGM